MYKLPIERIVILGGGTAGWMAAAALSERYQDRALDISVIESPDIATVGVGEATVPGIQILHQHLKISERDFVKATKATFKLGIEFKDWYKRGDRFFHPFSAFGVDISGRDFYQCWLKLHHEGYQFDLEDFCLSLKMAREGRFSQPDEDATTQLALYSYAYHFDASLYAKYLRSYAEDRRVNRIEGTVIHVNQDSHSGHIESLRLSDNTAVKGDLFIDCSGFRSLLLGKCMGIEFIDWSQYLPCDSAMVVQSENIGGALPYTVSTALEAGWQWRIPLQHRTGNGYVYSAQYLDDDSACNSLLAGLEGAFIGEPRKICFKAGMRRKFWYKNCVALGLAGGFLEPLESTSISLIQTGVEKIMQFLPDLITDPKKIEEANRLNTLEYERVRDFLILHYISSQRSDSEFWRSCKVMSVPDTLMEKLNAFEENGSILLYEQETFLKQSWIAMHNGFRRVPRKCSSSFSGMDSERLRQAMIRIRSSVSGAVKFAPLHSDFLADVCGAGRCH